MTTSKPLTRFALRALCLVAVAAGFGGDRAVPAQAQDTATDPHRLRIITDLDGDGVDDALVSKPLAMFGMSGGAWDVCLGRDGGTEMLGEITAHPSAVTLEPVGQELPGAAAAPAGGVFARIWVYLRKSGSQGQLGYYEVGMEGVGPLRAIEIQPGDGGTDTGRALYEAVFGSSPITYRVEEGRADPNGSLRWRPYSPK